MAEQKQPRRRKHQRPPQPCLAVDAETLKAVVGEVNVPRVVEAYRTEPYDDYLQAALARGAERPKDKVHVTLRDPDQTFSVDADAVWVDREEWFPKAACMWGEEYSEENFEAAWTVEGGTYLAIADKPGKGHWRWLNLVPLVPDFEEAVQRTRQKCLEEMAKEAARRVGFHPNIDQDPRAKALWMVIYLEWYCEQLGYDVKTGEPLPQHTQE